MKFFRKQHNRCIRTIIYILILIPVLISLISVVAYFAKKAVSNDAPEETTESRISNDNSNFTISLDAKGKIRTTMEKIKEDIQAQSKKIKDEFTTYYNAVKGVKKYFIIEIILLVVLGLITLATIFNYFVLIMTAFKFRGNILSKILLIAGFFIPGVALTGICVLAGFLEGTMNDEYRHMQS